jgi:hypothetical protein
VGTEVSGSGREQVGWDIGVEEEVAGNGEGILGNFGVTRCVKMEEPTSLCACAHTSARDGTVVDWWAFQG